MEPKTMRRFAALFGVLAVFLSTESQAQIPSLGKWECTEFRVGPINYQSRKFAVDISADACVEVNSTPSAIDLSAKISASLKGIQKAIDTVIQEKLSCGGTARSSYWVKLSNLRTVSMDGPAGTLKAEISIDGTAGFCPVTWLYRSFTISIPVSVITDKNTIALVAGKAKADFSGILGWLDREVALLGAHVDGRLNKMIDDMIKENKINLQPVQVATRRQFNMFNPKVNSIKLVTGSDELTVEVRMAGQIQAVILNRTIRAVLRKQKI